MTNIGVTQDIAPNMLEFRSMAQNEWVMRITADRRIEVNEDVDVTEAAQKVLNAVQHLLQPKREWVGLTDEEYAEMLGSGINAKTFTAVFKLLEAKLKEKNA